MKIHGEFGDCFWKDGFPILGDQEAVDQAIANRLLGTQGETEEEWLSAWRKEHNTYYLGEVDALIQERNTPSGRASAHFALVGADFHRADLRGKDLSGINLTNASFRGADLERANFTGATLVKCDFSRANVRFGIFDDADLSGSDMSMCYMKAASFRNARMWRVWLRHVMAESAQFFGTDLRHSDVRYSDFWGAKFDGALTDHVANVDKASFARWFNTETNQWSLDELPGYKKMVKNFTGSMTYRGNAGRRRE